MSTRSSIRFSWRDINRFLKGSRLLWLADQLKAGVVWGNTYNQFDPTSPFGGVKESGYGREGGRHGLAAYLQGEGH